MIIVQNFLILLLAGYLCDYPLQCEFLKKWKQQSNHVLFVHCFIWAGGICVGLHYLGLFAWWKAAMLFAGHFAVDYWKCRGLYKPRGISDITAFHADQLLHAAQVALCVL